MYSLFRGVKLNKRKFLRAYKINHLVMALATKEKHNVKMGMLHSISIKLLRISKEKGNAFIYKYCGLYAIAGPFPKVSHSQIGT